MDGENVNQNPAGAGEDLSAIMSGMSGGEKPTTQPTNTGGDKGRGQNAADSGNGSEGQLQQPKWFSQIGDITKDAAKAEKLAKFEKLSDLANAYFELDGKLGNSLTKPGENASDEERESFYRQLGKPESADKYSIKGDEAKAFREMAYKNNLTDEQATALFQSLQEVGKAAIANQQIAYKQQASETQAALAAEYGKDYPTKIELLKRGLKAYGGEAIANKLMAANLLGDIDVVKLFIHLGEMSSEAGAQTKNDGKADGYKSIANGGFLSTGDLFKKK